ncbi:ferritin-like domain-containing protein [Mesorhizobium sp. M0340]|uniref:DUF892 family protein n=1 Tax=Mesorhizobium sp. M0340 TaxID=2956939 RepID=UPI0033380971
MQEEAQTISAKRTFEGRDEIIKNSLANFTFENYEIAAYNSLLVLAEAGRFQDAERVLKQNLSEEEAMANWLKEKAERRHLAVCDVARSW